MGAFWRDLTSGDSQLRWLGPEKGVIHLACAAMVNAVWDLWAKREGKPVWQLLADMTPEALVQCLDFRFVSDALTPEESDRPAAPPGADQGRACGAAARARLPRLHPRRAGWATRKRRCATSAARRWTRVGATSSRRWRRHRGGSRPCPHSARGDRPRVHPDDGCQPDVGCRRSDRQHAQVSRVRSALDRGADQPRRHSRPCRDPPPSGADRRRHR